MAILYKNNCVKPKKNIVKKLRFYQSVQKVKFIYYVDFKHR